MAKLSTLHIGLIGVAGLVLLGLVIGLPAYFLTRESDSQGFNAIPREPYIQLKEGDLATAQPYVDEMNSFLKRYSDSQDVIDCSDENKPKENQVCKFSLDWFSECLGSKHFGLNTTKPCIMLKLSLDKDSKPQPYQSIDELPVDMPEDLKLDIQLSEDGGKLPQSIWVSCSNNVHLVEPWHMFPLYYFDNPDVEGYLPPLVAIKFKLNKNQDVKIECNLWAKNLDHKAESNKVIFTLRVE